MKKVMLKNDFTEEIIENVEDNIFNSDGENEQKYNELITSILMNVGSKKIANTDIHDILTNFDYGSGKDLPRGFGLFPSKWKEIDKKLKESVDESFKDITYYSKDITCPKCKKQTVSITSKQVRSADEPETAFYACKCGFRWKK